MRRKLGVYREVKSNHLYGSPLNILTRMVGNENGVQNLLNLRPKSWTVSQNYRQATDSSFLKSDKRTSVCNQPGFTLCNFVGKLCFVDVMGKSV